MSGQERANISWLAAQGNKTAQKQLSQILLSEGKNELAEFWMYKSGGGAEFTPENFRISK